MGVVTVLRRGIAARGARSIATAAAIAAAVAFLSGTFVLTDSIDASVQASASQATQGIAAIVTDAGGLGGSPFAGAAELPSSLLARIRQVPGVADAEGSYAGYAIPAQPHGDGLASTTGVGITLPADPRLRLLTLRSGHWPAGHGQVVVDAATAGKLGLASGSRVRLALASGARNFTVSGIAGFGSASTLAGVSLIGFAPGTAALLGAGGGYSMIEVAGGAGVSAAGLAARIRTAIGPGYRVRTGAEQAGHLAGVIQGAASVVGTAGGVFAVIALIVAALLIANIFTITVAQRSRELALLRCVGASRLQTARIVLAEAAVIGLFGGVTGLFGGVGLAAVLRAGLGVTGLPVPAARTAIHWHTVAAALAVGLGVTVVAAGGAAVRAARFRPLAALGGNDIARPRPGWTRRVAAACLALAGAFLLEGATQTPPVALGALLLLAGVGLAGPVLVRPLTWPARRLLAAATGICGRLAGRQMTRNPRRVAGAAGALGVAVAAVAIVATLAATFSSSAATAVSRSLHAAFVVSTPPGAGLNPGLARRIAGLPGVTQSAGLLCGPFSPPGGTETVCGIDPARMRGLISLDVRSGRLSDLTPGTIAVSARVATRSGWRLGQQIPVSYPLGGRRRVRIVALYEYDDVADSFLIPVADYPRFFPPAERTDQLILVNAAAGDTRHVRAELASLLTNYPQARLDDRSSYGSDVNSGIRLVAALASGMLALSLLVGLIAVAAALALSVLERTREIGLLRAVGAEAAQIRSMVRGEALATVTTGAVLGLILGMVIGWPLATAIDVYITGGPGVPVTLMIALVPAAVLAGLLAAAIPARSAARLRLLTALQAQ